MLNLKNYFSHHIQAGLNSLGHFSRAPMISFITCLVIGISLTLPTALYVALKNAENVRGQFHQTTQLTLYLKKDISDKQVSALTQSLEKSSLIKKVYPVSPDEGLRELQQQNGFQGVIKELQENPLPWSLIITPNTNPQNTATLEQLTQNLKQLPEVENVQMDMQWVKRLGSLIALGQRFIFTLAIFLCIAVLLIVNNTIRSATQSRQKEIEVIRLIGGTDTFIRRPFLYAGILYGLLGGIIAWQLVDILLIVVADPIKQLTSLYQSSVGLTGLGFKDSMLLLLISMALGLVGSWIAVMRYLKTR